MKEVDDMATLRTILLIFISIFVGNMVLMIFESAPINIWIARLIGGIACAITALIITRYYQNKNLKIEKLFNSDIDLKYKRQLLIKLSFL